MIIHSFHIEINRETVLRSCGFADENNMDAASLQNYERTYKEFINVINPTGGVKIVNLTSNESISFLVEEGCDYAAMTLYTLGSQIDKLINEKFSQGNYMAGILLDNMAVQYMFAMGEELDVYISNKCKDRGLQPLKRYSPYDNMDASYQKVIVDMIDIGVHVNDYMVMAPSKSCSHIIGIEKNSSGEIIDFSHDCKNCTNKKCIFRKEGLHNLTIVNRNSTQTIKANHKENLLSVLIANGYDIPSACKSKGTCGQCVVLANGKPLKSCLVSIQGDMQVEIPNIYNKSSIKTTSQNIYYEDIGVAIDVGSTTVAIALVDLKSNVLIEQISFLNRQRKHGLDVISRILAADNGFLAEMSAVVKTDILSAIQKMCESNLIKTENIRKTIITGNTVMMHIMLSKPCSALGKSTFVPIYDTFGFFEFSQIFDASHINATVYIPPYISAFIGGDILCGMVYCNGISNDYLLVDLGTNGEMAFYKNDRYTCTSTAAGPAFEGVGITWGVGGVEGAICSVDYDKQSFVIKTIANKPPMGICGSGIIDISATLLEHCFMDESGLLREPYFSTGIFLDKTIQFTQADIRQVQTAKSAIYSAIEIISGQCQTDKVEHLFISGGFGSEINIDNAVKIGLLPKNISKNTAFIGNSALKGALMLLQDEKPEKTTNDILEKSNYINLSNYPRFEQIFIKNMDFRYL